ncbi:MULTISPECIES: HdeA/HdeB family chaperone [Sphingomonas]|jgi:hypothetical protein|uniref:HdeA/HdeB family chaperone n=1 Tax=Sphingomonas TaxID=13687 RepID=UPI00062253A9|nr:MULTISPECIES: HdeA/HdeB family chaperone [Sphingomonas]KKI18377.1 hypothetical protein XM50_18345 [Sphingomonas sp. Ag1]
MTRSFVIAGAILAACAATTGSAQTTPQIERQAQVPQKDGMTYIDVFKVNKKMETITCRDFNLVDVNYRPQAVVFAANYGPKGKMSDPSVTVDGVASVVPVVVDACRATPGNNFVAAVRRAMAQQRAGMKR